jgi:hypothetical protein
LRWLQAQKSLAQQLQRADAPFVNAYKFSGLLAADAVETELIDALG